MLVTPVYMLQVYDRILTSGSIDTLTWISVICLYLLGVYAIAELARRRVFALLADELNSIVPGVLFRNFRSTVSSEASFAEEHRSFMKVYASIKNGLIAPLFDLPFVPFFLALLFFVHPLLGVVGLSGMCILITIALLGRLVSSANSEKARSLEAEVTKFSSGVSRQRSAIVAMGMGQALENRFDGVSSKSAAAALEVSKQDGGYAGTSRASRQSLQVIILGVGGLLAVQQEVSAGAIVAGSILMGRALAPIDQLVSGWRQLMDTRAMWRRVKKTLECAPEPSEFTSLPKPQANIAIASLAISVPGSEHCLIKPFSISVHAGSVVALVGGNGSGKSSLLQTIAGAWAAHSGKVYIGGRDIHAWPSGDRGKYIGYVPQGIELLPGTVRDNISRFAEDVKDDEVISAAMKVGAHDDILSLPGGYDTLIGPGGSFLSAGQSQSIALARAFFADPAVVLLDEPTANLDLAAACDIISTIKSAANSGMTFIVSTHDMRLIEKSSQVIFLSNGSAKLGSPDQFVRQPSGFPNINYSMTGGG